jgi:hypothetical protein
VLAACTTTACSEDERSLTVDGDRDGAAHGAAAGDATIADASASGDGSASGPAGATMDAAALDLDASLLLPEGTWILADGAILLPDGQVIDVDAALMRFEADPDLAACDVVSDDIWQAPVEIEAEGGFALVPGPTGFGLAYRSIGRATCAQNIEVAHIAASSGLPEPGAVLVECTAITDVALAWASSGWHLAWIDNFTDRAELHTATLDAQLQISGAGRRTLTDDEHELERKPVLAAIGGRPLLVWSARGMAAGPSSIRARWLDGDADSFDLVTADEEHAPQALALAQIGSESAAIGWVGPGESPGVWLLRLDADGARAGAPVQLTERVAVSSSIDIARRSDGGAAVYSIEIDGAPQVRFRRLDATGTPIADERVLIGPPLRAQDASVFALAGGYVVVYRALPGGSIDRPEIRMTFVTKEGAVIRDAAGSVLSTRIASSTIATARTSVTVSVDGQIMIGWLDADSGSGHNALHVARRRLDCN